MNRLISKLSVLHWPIKFYGKEDDELKSIKWGGNTSLLCFSRALCYFFLERCVHFCFFFCFHSLSTENETEHWLKCRCCVHVIVFCKHCLNSPVLWYFIYMSAASKNIKKKWKYYMIMIAMIFLFTRKCRHRRWKITHQQANSRFVDFVHLTHIKQNIIRFSNVKWKPMIFYVMKISESFRMSSENR